MDEMYHIVVSHHVLNDHCHKQLVCNDFRIINHFCLLWLSNTNHKFNYGYKCNNLVTKTILKLGIASGCYNYHLL